MHAAALLTLHALRLAADELRCCVEELGMVAAQMAPKTRYARVVPRTCGVL